jgi:hypothetical protein
MQKYVKRAGDERLTKIPADLDTKPYRDEHDTDLLRRMMLAVERGHVPPARGAAAVRNAVHKILGETAHRPDERRRAGGTTGGTASTKGNRKRRTR